MCLLFEGNVKCKYSNRQRDNGGNRDLERRKTGMCFLIDLIQPILKKKS